MRTRIKVCCIASVDEARTAISLGADAIGLVASMPSGPGPIPDSLIATIARSVPPPIATFLLTCRTDPRGVASHVGMAGVNTVQLVDEVDPGVFPLLRESLPHVRIVQVIHVQNESDIDRGGRCAQLVDALLLDSGRPAAAIKELGGTGRTHDWSISRRIVESVRVPVFLAGGLNASNVRGAVEAVRPYGVDVCSGVRTNGKLDGAKLDAFVRALA